MKPKHLTLLSFIFLTDSVRKEQSNNLRNLMDQRLSGSSHSNAPLQVTNAGDIAQTTCS